MTNLDHISSLNPQKRPVFILFLNECKKLGWTIIITQSYRSIATQNRLHKENPKNSIGGYSAHNYGFAIDVNFIKDEIFLKKSTPKSEWLNSGIIDIAKKIGLRWGGEFENYYDPIHFDCVLPSYTKKWYAYIIKTYPNTFETLKTNEINWKFYEESK